MEIKVGDRVRATIACCGTVIGEEYITQNWYLQTDGHKEFYAGSTGCVYAGEKGRACCCFTTWELVEVNNPNNNDKNKNMTLIEKARLLVKGEPDKSLVNKGITKMDDTLTSNGVDLLLDYLYRTNKDAFVKDPAIAALLVEKDKDNS